MSPEATWSQSVGEWVVGVILTLGVGLFVFLARLVFSRVVLDRLDQLGKALEATRGEVIGEIRQLAQVQQNHEQRLALGNQAFTVLRDELHRVQAEVVELRRTVAELREARA